MSFFSKSTLRLIAQTKTMASEETSTALEAIKKGLHAVKVSKHDAHDLERKLRKELFSKWEEKVEVMKSTKIPVEEIAEYLNYMENSYEGIDSDMRKKMDGIKFAGTWENKIVEWKYNAEESSGARYGMLAFGKSSDKKYIDCMYLLYKIDFNLAPTERVTTDSMYNGLMAWTTTTVHKESRKLGIDNIKQLQNFFRLKALNGFYNEGVIDRINYVRSIEDIPDSEISK